MGSNESWGSYTMLGDSGVGFMVGGICDYGARDGRRVKPWVDGFRPKKLGRSSVELG